MSNKVNLILSSVALYKDYEKQTGIHCRRFCYGADSDIFFNRSCEKIYDIGFSGALHENKIYQEGAFETFNIRSRIQDILSKEPNIKVFLNGSDSVNPRIKDYCQYASIMSQSKVWITTNAAFLDIVPRYFEIPMAGTLLMCNEVADSYKDIFRDGENCVVFKNDLSDFRNRLYYGLENWKRIVDISNKEFLEQHTWTNRADELLRIIEGMK